MQQQHLQFEVTNSVTQQTVMNQEGTGIANVKRRLELIMPMKHQLEILPGKSEFKVRLSLAL